MAAPLRIVRADLRELATTYCFTAAAAGAYGACNWAVEGYVLAVWLALPRLVLSALRAAGRIAYSDAGAGGGVLKIERVAASLRDAARPAEPAPQERGAAPFFPESEEASGLWVLLYAALGLAVAAVFSRYSGKTT
ncbi:MAG: hypothetical protein HY928_05445 [Elusimicrobia bacterium]|nr:hypothetical protein [Elusimicrobiota bacterium]